ncbi:uncharacterized protein LOC134664982 isoform X2 [Cydia fagiglandana]|uniref:uncharacterized protein LOC134664982 isoform X2 n=1 Tax=Cydia fagiglandana TaxID=1458189 RepID=UPI002FEE21DB
MLYCAQESNRWSVGPCFVSEYKWRLTASWACEAWDISRPKCALATPSVLLSTKFKMADTKKGSIAGQGQTLEDVNQNMEQKENELKLDLQKDAKDLKKLKTCVKAVGIAFSVVTVITALLAISLIAVSTMSAVAASAMDAQDDSGRLVALVVLAVTAAVTIAIVVYAQIATCSKKIRPIFVVSDDTGRLVALVVLAVTAAVTIAIVVYAQIATCSKKIRPIFVATIVLSILMVIQGIIAHASVRVSPKDAENIQQSLRDSFDLAAKQHSPRHVKMWATTQSTFHCCGFQSPYDYTHNGLQTPDVPISCCPTYDSERSDLLQEKERFMCKDRREFFDAGIFNSLSILV